MKILFIICSACILIACGKDAAPPPKIAAPQRDALDKAKSVEKTLQQEQDAQQKLIDDNSK